MKKEILRLFLAAVLVIGFGTASMGQTARVPQKHNKETAAVKPLPTNQVCMINNKFMSKDQIPVQVNNKTYYGCCQGCVGTLKNDQAARTATDEVTKQQVDKATAFIIVKPGTRDDVLYFVSKQNAATYLQRASKK